MISVAKPQKIFSSKIVTNALTIDLEDWFHVSNFIPYIRRDDWDRCPSRVRGWNR